MATPILEQIKVDRNVRLCLAFESDRLILDEKNGVTQIFQIFFFLNKFEY